MEHGERRQRNVTWALVALLLAITSCSDTPAKKKPDAGLDAGSGSSSPCVLDTSKLDGCSL